MNRYKRGLLGGLSNSETCFVKRWKQAKQTKHRLDKCTNKNRQQPFFGPNISCHGWSETAVSLLANKMFVA